jgi:hypothetical protein
MISPQDLDPLSGTAPARATVAPLDLDLIRRYAGPAPRYTSYPPATQFHADLAALDLNARLAEDNRLTPTQLRAQVERGCGVGECGPVHFFGSERVGEGVAKRGGGGICRF